MHVDSQNMSIDIAIICSLTKCIVRIPASLSCILATGFRDLTSRGALTYAAWHDGAVCGCMAKYKKSLIGRPSDQWSNNIGLKNYGRTFYDPFFNEIRDLN
jgi:hypothetical protein